MGGLPDLLQYYMGGGSGQFITILHGGGGVFRDPQIVLRNIWTAPNANLPVWKIFHISNPHTKWTISAWFVIYFALRISVGLRRGISLFFNESTTFVWDWDKADLASPEQLPGWVALPTNFCSPDLIDHLFNHFIWHFIAIASASIKCELLQKMLKVPFIKFSQVRTQQ